MELKEKMDRMVEELNAANYRYYVLDDPTMDDRDYDLKLRKLEELEQAHPELARADSPTKRVGGEALSKFEKVTHPVPLNSLVGWSRKSTVFPWHWNMRMANSSGEPPVETATWART